VPISTLVSSLISGFGAWGIGMGEAPFGWGRQVVFPDSLTIIHDKGLVVKGFCLTGGVKMTISYGKIIVNKYEVMYNKWKLFA
jgi:hypothetical protein